MGKLMATDRIPFLTDVCSAQKVDHVSHPYGGVLPDSILPVHREADGQVEGHEIQADVFFVQSGSATLVVGGILVNGETVGPMKSATARFRVASGGRFRPEMLSVFLCGCHISSCLRAPMNQLHCA